MEEVKFVWEKKASVYLKEARKARLWKDMKWLYNTIEENIKTLEEIKHLAELAENYGVLEVNTYYGTSAVEFEHGRLMFFVNSVMREIFGKSTDKEGINAIKELGGMKALERIIEWENQQKELMEQYLKDAERYLTVTIETQEEDC